MMNNLKLLFLTLSLSAAVLSACQKAEPPVKEDLYPEQALSTPSSSAIATFHQPVSYYQMFVYRYDESTAKWGNRIAGHFSTVPATDSTVLGFSNPYVQDSGVPLFDMVRLYAAEIGNTNIKTAGINSEKVLKFFPDYANAKTGIVQVISQEIVIRKAANAGMFTIGISGSGTYDENTKLIDLEVSFDESAIGGTTRKFKYKMSPVALSLN